MAYLMWPLIGIVVAMLVGVRVLRPSTHAAPRTSFLAGAFGGFVGGVIGDGLPHVQGIDFNLPSIVGAVLGALLLCLAVRDRASDTEH